MGQKKYSKRIRLKAKELFLKGESISEVARKVSEWTGRNCIPLTIDQWSKKEGWDKDLSLIVSNVNNDMIAEAENEFKKRSREQLEAYQKMIQAGLDALDSGTVPLAEASDIVSFIDKGIRGERSISAGLVSWKFIEKVAVIICEEVQDDQLRRKIGNRLIRLSRELVDI